MATDAGFCAATGHSPWTPQHSPSALGVTLISSLIASILEAQHLLGDASIYPADATSLLEAYDFIMVGAGTAGSVVANRLSEQRDWSVLLLEAGGDPPLTSEIPPLFHSLQETDIDWMYKTEPQEHACLGMREQRCNWPRGKVLGGSGILNAMLHVRGNRRDYDAWAQAGNTGWSYQDVLPYFKKSEDMKSVELSQSPHAEYSETYHGTGGYLSLEQFLPRSPIVDGLLQVAEDMGYRVGDVNGASQTGFTLQHGTLINGTRCSTAKAFLSPIKNRSNFHLVKHAHVTRILIDPETKTAFGIEFKKDGKIHTVRISKEVILSAGTVNSAQLLMLSGIGPKEHLEQLEIPVIQNLKVGENLQDHMQLPAPTFMFNKSHPVGIDPVRVAEDTLEYLLHRKGPLASIDILQFQGFVSSKYADPNIADYPDIQYQHIRFPHKDTATAKRVAHVTAYTEDISKVVFDIPNSKSEIYIPLSVLQRPKSRGFIKLRSKDPFEHPIIDPKYLSDPQDVLILVEGIKFASKMATNKHLKRFEVEISTERVPGCTEEYGTDDYWACVVRKLATTIYHPVGTCKMGPPSDSSAVVDPRLRVHGVKGIRVIDASIIPTIVTGNTNAPAIMIGEKGADMVKEDWLKS